MVDNPDTRRRDSQRSRLGVLEPAGKRTRGLAGSAQLHPQASAASTTIVHALEKRTWFGCVDVWRLNWREARESSRQGGTGGGGETGAERGRPLLCANNPEPIE